MAQRLQTLFRNYPISERGNTTFVLGGVVVVIGVLFVASLGVARAAYERSDAQAGADAVALAGAQGDRAAATLVAARNGVHIVKWNESSDSVEVTVVLERANQHASARAERAWSNGPITIDIWIPIEND